MSPDAQPRRAIHCAFNAARLGGDDDQPSCLYLYACKYRFA
jgi:hypothetical protein